MSPTISIGVPVYNGENFLAECLDAALAQDLPITELLISDNASTDATPDIAQEFARRDPRVRFVRQPQNTGAAANHNYVIGHTSGDLYKTATHDDLMAPAFVRRCVEALAAHHSAVVAFPRTTYINAAGEVIGDDDGPIMWTHAATPSGRLHDLFVDHASSYLHHCYPVMGLMRRSALSATRGIQPFQSSDAALLVELALRGDFVEVPEHLYLKRLHEDTSMASNRTPEEFATWFDPANAQRAPLPRSRLLAAYTTAVLQAPLSPGERLRCLGEVGGWLGRDRRWRVIGGELKEWGTNRARRLRATASRA
jgi:glycosyltransferase involved in cell wall biosynthesis